jgi:starvation-inducible DNA-binding protein
MEIQPYGTIAKYPIALAESVCEASVETLHQLLADMMTPRDMYKKRNWQVTGPAFYQVHLLYDKHHKKQSQLVDKLADRIQTLSGICIAKAWDMAQMTLIPGCLAVARRFRCNLHGCFMRMRSSCSNGE